MRRRTLVTQRVSLPRHLRGFIESAFHHVRTRSARKRSLRREGAGAIWFCHRLPCWGQVHGPSHLGEYEALLSRCANMPDSRWRFWCFGSGEGIQTNRPANQRSAICQNEKACRGRFSRQACRHVGRTVRILRLARFGRDCLG